MATLAAINRGISSSSSSSLGQLKSSQKKKMIGGGVGRRFEIRCVAGSDPYKTLRIRPGASESEVKKAFRRLALQYHPDVCQGRNCGTKFQKINEAYDTVMSHLKATHQRAERSSTYVKVETDYSGETFNPEGMWDEWTGWEAAGMFREFHDYTGAEYQ